MTINFSESNLNVTDLLIQRGPSADSVTRPVEALSQRVSSSPPFLAAVLSSVRVYATSLFQINATATLATHNVLETVSVYVRNKA